VRGVYCWPQSVRSGERVSIFFGPNEGTLSLSVARQGLKNVEVLQKRRVLSRAQEPSENLSVEGARWDPCEEIVIDKDWPGGFYLVSVTEEGGRVSEGFFVVRGRQIQDGMLVLSTSTWAAYNNWGGPSFYTGGQHSSFCRPLPKGFLNKHNPEQHRIAFYHTWGKDTREDFQEHEYGAWCMAAGWANQELLFVRWAEAQGLNLDYATSMDLDREGDLLSDYSLYLSVGHDEYWSAAMRDSVESFVDQGGNAAFFSGNTAFWQARFENDYETLTCYKNSIEQDPLYDAVSAPGLSTMWSDPLVGRPESEMTGVSFTHGGYAHMPSSPEGSGGYSVCRPEHWAFEGLDVVKGGGLGEADVTVGYECDGCLLEDVDGVQYAVGPHARTGFEVLATAPAHLWETNEAPGGLDESYVGELNWVAERLGGEDTELVRAKYSEGHAVMGSFSRGKGSVFTTGCTDWAYGLGQPDVSRVTLNVVDRFLRRTK
jgi:hypothetical protein